METIVDLQGEANSILFQLQSKEEALALEKRLTQIQQDLVNSQDELTRTNENLESKEKVLHNVGTQFGLIKFSIIIQL